MWSTCYKYKIVTFFFLLYLHLWSVFLKFFKKVEEILTLFLFGTKCISGLFSFGGLRSWTLLILEKKRGWYYVGRVVKHTARSMVIKRDDDSENDIFRSKDNGLKQKKLASKSSSYSSRRKL